MEDSGKFQEVPGRLRWSQKSLKGSQRVFIVLRGVSGCLRRIQKVSEVLSSLNASEMLLESLEMFLKEL